MKATTLSLLIALSLSSLSHTFASQLTPESQKIFIRELVDNTYGANFNSYVSTSVVKASKSHCLAVKELRAKGLPKWGDPNRDELLKPFDYHNDSCYQDIIENFETNEVVAIVFRNFLSPKINPYGHRKQLSPHREYTFNMHGRLSQSLSLGILDNPQTTLDPKTNKPTASGNEMYSEIIFIPRKVFPYIKKVDTDSSNYTELHLPTDEVVIFDSANKEIIGGVLTESPIDRNANRHSRKFAQVQYTGKGLTIRVDRRFGSPKKIHNEPFNDNENLTHAIVMFQEKECLVPKSELWSEARNFHKVSYFKFADDQKLIDDVINPVCGWNIKLTDFK